MLSVQPISSEFVSFFKFIFKIYKHLTIPRWLDITKINMFSFNLVYWHLNFNPFMQNVIHCKSNLSLVDQRLLTPIECFPRAFKNQNCAKTACKYKIRGYSSHISRGFCLESWPVLGKQLMQHAFSVERLIKQTFAIHWSHNLSFCRNYVNQYEERVAKRLRIRKSINSFNGFQLAFLLFDWLNETGGSIARKTKARCFFCEKYKRVG